MRVLLCFALICLTSIPVCAQNVPAKPAGPSGSLAGRWIVTADVYGTSMYFTLELEQQGDKLSGNLDGDKLEGSVSGSSIQFQTKDEHGGVGDAKATMKGDVISGSFVFTDGNDPTHKETHTFTAARAAARKPEPPKRHEFTPNVFYRRLFRDETRAHCQSRRHRPYHYRRRWRH